MLIADVTMVRMVQEALRLVQYNVEAGSMSGLNRGPEVVQNRLNLPPVDVITEGILKYRI
jgi:hypothetical protein